MGAGSLSAVRTTAAKVPPDRRLGRHSISITAAAISLTGVTKCRIPHYQRVGSRALEVKGASGSTSRRTTEGGARESVNLFRNNEEATVTYLSRRSILRGSLAVAAARPFVGPHIARAAATTASVWFAQGFVQDEDVSLRKAVADYEKQSGNKIELSITPFAPDRQKIIAALTRGVVPDLIGFSNPNEILQIYAWQDRWVEVADVVETQRAQFSDTALVASQAYNSVTKKRATYGVPIRAAIVPCHIWKSLVEKAGMKLEDIPKTWDAYFDFFKKVQDNLRKQGERKVYGIGFQVTANGVDPYNLFMAFLVAYGGQDVVTRDGKLHLDDPKVRQAAIKAAAYLGGAYRDGYVPPSAINWNDADDNNAFHAKLMVMDVD